VIYAVHHGTLPRPTLLLPFVYWGGLYVALFAGFVARSWYGVRNLRRTLAPIMGVTSDDHGELPAQLTEPS
jgi:hypothetical protein